jgi:hypothetical protein
MCGRIFLYSVQLNGELFPGRNNHPLGPALSLSGAPHLLFRCWAGHPAIPFPAFPFLAFVWLRPRRSSSSVLYGTTDILARMRWTGLELIWVDSRLLVINGILRPDNDWRRVTTMRIVS